MKFYLYIFLFSFAQAEDIDSNTLDAIIEEAIFFFVVISIMAIVSIIISKKNAKKYEIEHPVKERKAATRKRILFEEYLNSSSIKLKGKAATLLDLSKMLKDKVIDEEEFEILKDSLNSSPDS